MDTVDGFGPRLRHPVMRRFVMRCGLPYYLYVTNAMEKSQSWSNVTDKDVVFGLLLLLLFQSFKGLVEGLLKKEKRGGAFLMTSRDVNHTTLLLRVLLPCEFQVVP